MRTREDLINELAWLCGIVFDYWDIFGNKHITPISTKEAILRSMRLRIETPQEILEEIIKIYDRAWTSFIVPVKVISVNNQPLNLSVYIPLNEGDERNLILYCRIENEKGKRDDFKISRDSLHISEQKWINNQRYVKFDFNDGQYREIGYYSFYARCHGAYGEISGLSRIIITPDKCYIPPELEQNKRLWGISLNLYSVRSFRNWGCGDLNDLNEIAKWIWKLNGGFVAINPMHALLNKRPYDISPYSPVSRLYRNFIYLDIDSVPEVADSEDTQALMRTKTFKDKLKRLRDSDLIDYETVAAIKEKILRFAFEIFYEKHFKQDTRRGKSFDRYLSDEGDPLRSFCVFMALSRKNKSANWDTWLEEFHNSSGKATSEFMEANAKEILFYSYIQWLIDSDIKNISESCKRTSPLGLMFDLAIGSTGGGSDVWNYKDIFALGMNVGAPPDDFNPIGQDWGFPPLIPEIMKQTGYEFFIHTIKKTMKYAGALRIDHALGMFRLFWIPEGSLPSEGAYIVYPSEDLLRIIALESVRNKTLIVAEDLGTVGEHVHNKLRDFNMLSYKLLYFERNYPEFSFTPPEKYPQRALCAITTHDLATCNGFWAARDIEIKKKLGLFTNEEKYHRHQHDRIRDRELLLKALKEQGIIPEDYLLETPDSFSANDELCLGVYEFLARTPSMLVSVSMDDMLGIMNQQNLPGVIELYPCWRQKLPLNLEDIFEDNRFKILSTMFTNNGR